MTLSESCPQNHLWQQMLAETLAADQESTLVEHLDHCDRCRTLLEALVGGADLSDVVARRLSSQDPMDEVRLQPWIDRLKQISTRSAIGPREDRDEQQLKFLEPSDDPKYAGRLGRYSIINIVGRGGMGLVLRAWDPTLNRIVAIKVLTPRLANDRSSRKRFLREARAAAAITNAHVVPIYSVGKCGEMLYLEMQLVEGNSLQEKLDQQGPLNYQEIVRIGMQTAKGLAAAHARGLIHRDVKPANILLEQETQQVRISDFGLACVVAEAHQSSSELLVGTPEYMAPEQIYKTDVDHRADLFSFGNVLYAMCTGQSPFAGGTTLDVIKRVAKEDPPPLSKINPEIPQVMVDIIARLHAKDPADRFQSTEEVYRQLKEQLGFIETPSPPVVPAPLLRSDDPVSSAEFSPRLARRHRSSWQTRRKKIRPLVVSGSICLTIAVIGFLLLEAAGVTQILISRRANPDSSDQLESINNHVTDTAITSNDQQPFVILADGSQASQSFENLATAIRTSRDGDTIEIHGNGPFRCPPMQIVDKRLRIRAAPNSRPVLEMQATSADGENPLLWTNQPLVLEGIALHRFSTVPANRFQPRNALLRTNQSELWVAHCRFVFNQRLCGIRTEYSPLCRIRNCDFIGSQGTAVGSMHGPNGRLFVHNNVIASNVGLLGEYHRSNIQNTLVVFSRNTVFSRDAMELVLHSHPDEPGQQEERSKNLVQFQVRQNVFRVSESLLHVEQSGEMWRNEGYLRQPVRDWLTATINWNGTQNLYDIGRQLVRVTLEGRPSKVSPLTRNLEDWQQLWDGTDLDSQSVQVEFQGIDRLAAIEDSPEQLDPKQLRLITPESSSAESQPWGADVAQAGPGQPYQSWRKTTEYLQWQRASGFPPDEP
jgi:serine/threonine protein kinase